MGAPWPMPGPFRRPQGRPKGAVNKATSKIRNFCREILESEEYRESLRRRIRNDDLAAAVELRLYDYAYGKPADKLKIEDDRTSSEDLRDVPTDVIADRAIELARIVKQGVEDRIAAESEEQG